MRSIFTTFCERHTACAYYYNMFKLFDPNSDFQIIAGSNLPHWFQLQATYFITFRTEDSLPRHIVRQWYIKRSAWFAQHGISTSMPNWKDKLAELPERLRKNFHQTFSWQYMEYLDKGLGACVLQTTKTRKDCSR